MFNLTTQSKINLRETIKFKKLWLLWNRSWGRFIRQRLTLFLPTFQRQNLYIEDFVYILVICEARSVWSSVGLKVSARVRQSSVTSNTMWANLNLFGQIIIQRCFVFVSTVELRTLYVQELPYMNTYFVNASWKKIGLTHAHFQYNSRKLVNVVKVRFTMMYSSRKLNNKKVITTDCNFWRQIACS